MRSFVLIGLIAVLTFSPAQAIQPDNNDARLAEISEALTEDSLRSFRRSVARGEPSGEAISIQLELWRDLVELRNLGPNAVASLQAEIETFDTVRSWTAFDSAGFEALMAEILQARGDTQPYYDPNQTRDQGLMFSRPYVRWVLVQRGDGLGPAGQLLIASDRLAVDGLWWEQVDLAYWRAEQAGADEALLSAFRAVLRGYIQQDFDQIDYDWVRRSTGSEFMRNPSISLAFDYVDEARRLRAQ